MILLRPTRPALVVASAVLTSAALAACGNGVASSHGDSGAALSTPTASPTPSTPSGSATPQPGSASPQVATKAASKAASELASQAASARAKAAAEAAAARPTPSGPAPCAVSNLRVGSKAPAGGASAGSSYLLLTFRNVSSTTCTMDGHPGVSFVGRGNGTQLGSPAARSGGLRTVVLAPGATTTALLQVANAGDYDADTCVPTTSNGLRVYPPDSRASVYVPFTTQACQATDLSSPQLSVSAVGRAPAS